MSDDALVLPRRAAVAAAGLGALALLSLRPAAAAEQSAQQKEDIDLVHAFIHAWKGPPDTAKLGSYIAEQCFVSIIPGPPAPATTRAGAVEVFESFLKTAPEGFDLNILSTTARGGAVFITRRDYGIKDGKHTDAGAPAVAMLIVKDGKISNWYDYTFTT